MNDELTGLIAELNAAKGLGSADLLIHNLKILDVFTEKVFPGSILIKNGKIIALNPGGYVKADAKFDGQGLVAVPGFIDAHMHIDTTLVTPEALVSTIVPWGTTSLIAEVLDFTSAVGQAKTRILLRNQGKWPCRFFVSAPGKMVDVEVTEDFLADAKVDNLGEMLPAGILNVQQEELSKIVSAKMKKKVVTGHVGNVTEEQLSLFALAGLTDDHEAWEYDEACMLLRHGIRVMIRDCSTMSSLAKIIGGVVKNNLPIENLMFCSDDVYINDLVANGHINYTVKKAINLGMDPIKAIKIATINAARHFKIDDKVGSLTPGRYADLVLLNSLEDVNPRYVFANGKLVAQEGRMLEELKGDYPELYREMPRGMQDLKPEDLVVKSANESAIIPVLDVSQQQVGKTEELFTADGNGVVKRGGDLQKLSIIERYPVDQRNIINVFVRGFNLKYGALATLFTQQGHKVNVVGTNERDMCFAAKIVDEYPGALVAVAEEKVISVLPLPLECMLSDLSAHEAAEVLNNLHAAAKDLGCNLPSPFMTLWFLPFFLR